ncbi:hypothetical protein [Sphingomonas sp.]|uniref:hypothetical protein n=1 Tax=Sphingomonas sp. TaxID=28214 RepID=UPI003B3B544E
MDDAARQRALFIGLAALQDYVDQARRNPLRGTVHLRALLAALALHGKGDPTPYQHFWDRVREPLDPNAYSEAPQHYERGTYAQTYWTMIARDLGFPADSVDFCHRINAAVAKARRPPSEEESVAIAERERIVQELRNAVHHREFVATKGRRGMKPSGYP